MTDQLIRIQTTLKNRQCQRRYALQTIDCRDRRIRELLEQSNDLRNRYENMLAQNKRESQRLKNKAKRLKNDNNTLSATLSMKHRKNKQLQQAIKDQTKMEKQMVELQNALKGKEEEIRKKNNEIRRIKGNEHYRHWSTEDVVDWMMALENGRYRIYEQKLMENLQTERVAGPQMTALTESDLYRWGIVHFEDKKAMMVAISQFVAKCQNEGEDPELLCDPITFELMRDPVMVTLSGRTYERKTIKSIIKKGDKEPFSGHQVTKQHLVSNKLIKEMIEKYKANKVVIQN